jgi:hypothetical protein
LGYLVIIWYFLCSFGTFFLVWYHVPRKIWQPCTQAGTLNGKCDGDCECKVNVAGDSCDRCKDGFYALHEANPDGCLVSYQQAEKNCHLSSPYPIELK